MICGADVQQTDSSGCTPLFYATALGHADCVRLLLDSNADLDHQDNKGRTAAHCGESLQMHCHSHNLLTCPRRRKRSIRNPKNAPPAWR